MDDLLGNHFQRIKAGDAVSQEKLADYCRDGHCNHTAPGIAGVEPCTRCGRPMDGAFERIGHIRDEWFHIQCATAPAPDALLELLRDISKFFEGQEHDEDGCKVCELLARLAAAIQQRIAERKK